MNDQNSATKFKHNSSRSCATYWQSRPEEAQSNYGVGLLYSIKQDHQEAYKWFIKAAEQGHAGAQLILGVMYCNGEGVHQDYQEAFKWFTRSAEQGNADAPKPMCQGCISMAKVSLRTMFRPINGVI